MASASRIYLRRVQKQDVGPDKEARFALDSPLEGDGFEPSVPREGVKGQSPQFHADYPPIGWAHEQHMKRMLNGFKRDGITCPAHTGCQPDRLS